MDPDEQKSTYDEIPEESTPPVSPWQSSQDEPVVRVTPPPEDGQPPAGEASSSAGLGGSKPKRAAGQRLRAVLRSRKFWLFVLVSLVVAFLALWFVQSTRWWMMNLFGGRNMLTITTITPAEGKAKASQLRNVMVTVNGVTYRTDSTGTLKVPDIPYGQVTITAAKTGFKSINYGVTLDFDPFFHKFGGASTDGAARNITLSMISTGIPVSFKVVDSLSGQPITSGEFTVDDVVAQPDSQGLVSLRVPGTDDNKVNVAASFGGAYNDQKFDVGLGASTPPIIKAVPSGRDYFISKRSGVLTLYGCNLDGSDVQPIVAGTGNETDATTFAVSPDGKYGVLSSSRDDAYDTHHDLLQRIYIVNLSSKQIMQVDEGVNVAFADWSGNELIYTTTAYDASSNTFPTTLRGVDVDSQRVYNFETADSISVGTVAAGRVLYLRTSNSGPDQVSSPILREAPVNATSSQTLGDQVGYDNYLQLAYDRVDFMTAQDQSWHEYNLSSQQLQTVQQPTSGSNAQRYLSVGNSDGSNYLIVDRIGGQYSLLLQDPKTGKQTILYNGDGLSGPIRWVSDKVVSYRISDSSQAADYVISLDGGQPQKVTDVFPDSSNRPANDPRLSLY